MPNLKYYRNLLQIVDEKSYLTFDLKSQDKKD